jgi:hypothetical protein
MWVQLAIWVAAMVVSYAMTPKPATPKAATLDDFEFPQGTEGTAQMFVFGDVWIDGWQVVGVGNFRTSPIRR